MKNFLTKTFLLVFLFYSCHSVKELDFPVPVDTNTKVIRIAEKKTFEIPEMGVFASNQFLSGRLDGFTKLNDSTISVLILPENKPINMSPWFAFKIWSTQSKTVYLQFKYTAPNMHRYVPKIKKENSWETVDSTQYTRIDNIVTLKLAVKKKPQLIAAQEVISSVDVKNWVNKIAKGNESWVRIKSAGKSKLNKDLPVLDIYNGKPKGKEIIMLLTRQHPPEVTGYLVFQHFLETLLKDEKTEAFFDKYRVIAFPIMNPDGVDLGHWRHNAGGVDLNRDWAYFRQPETRAAVSYIEKAVRKNKSKLILGLDCHSTWYDVFYTNEERANTALPDFIPDWFQIIESRIPDYKVNEKPAEPGKPTSKGWFLDRYQSVGITYEIGDETPRDFIKTKGMVSAKAMMELLLNENKEALKK